MNAVQTNNRPSMPAEVANIVLGIWVFLSPFILGFQNIAGKWTNIAVGAALVLVALVGGRWNEIFEALVVPLCVWLFASPFVLGFSKTAFLANNVVMAFIVIAAGAISNGLRFPKPPISDRAEKAGGSSVP